MSSTTGELTVPPSPRYQTVLSTFTTLNDDIWPNLCSGISHPHEISSASEAFQESPLRGPSVCNSPGDLRLSPNLQPRLQNHQFHSREKAKKKQVSRVQEHFFCLATGKVVKKERKRSAFTKERRREVTQVRDLGACLRCRIRKKPCSGGNPCEACLSLANAELGSRTLMWMECIRLTIADLNPFDKDYTARAAYIEQILEGVQQHDVHLNFEIPFARNSLDTAKRMACWLTEETASTFSVVGLLSTSGFTHLLSEVLDCQLARDVRLLVNLTSHLFTDGKLARFGDIMAEDIELVRDYVGNRVIAAVSRKLKPGELKKQLTEAQKPHVLFLLTFSVAVALGYTIGVNTLNDINGSSSKGPHDTLLQLICHYLVYIGKFNGILQDGVEEKPLVGGAKNLWHKQPKFGWYPTPSRRRIFDTACASFDQAHASSYGCGQSTVYHRTGFFQEKRSRDFQYSESTNSPQYSGTQESDFRRRYDEAEAIMHSDFTFDDYRDIPDRCWHDDLAAFTEFVGSTFPLDGPQLMFNPPSLIEGPEPIFTEIRPHEVTGCNWSYAEAERLLI